jgi:ubiquinone/menaquinone biosynthesis C-methylase UbiE
MTSSPTHRRPLGGRSGSAAGRAERTPELPSHEDTAIETGYIMEGAGEAERLRLKTEHVLVRRHLDWAGLVPGQSFVDIGCGSGEVILAAAIQCRPGQVMGIDANCDRLIELRRWAAEQRLPNVRLHAASLAGPGSSGLGDEAFDHAWARFFLEYHPRPVGVVAEMARIVRPGGRVTLIDLEGNGVWHYGMNPRLQAGLDSVVADLKQTGFDPHIGRRLTAVARAAGLTDVRHEIEPYHRIVGRPDARTLDLWRRKIQGLRANYLGHLFPEKTHLAWVFDAYLDFLEREDTMTWSLLHLVQGTVPSRSGDGELSSTI